MALTVKAVDAQSPVDFSVCATIDNELGKIYTLTIHDVYASQNYRSFHVMFPRELELHHAAIDGNWNCTKVPGSATFIALGDNPHTPAQMASDMGKLYFTIIDESNPPSQGSKICMNASSGQVAVYVDPDGMVHYYEFVPVSGNATWLDMLIAAQGSNKTVRVAGGGTKTMRGYLATITSEEEQHMLFGTISNRAGWIGGTRLQDVSNKNPNAPYIQDFPHGGTGYGSYLCGYDVSGSGSNVAFGSAGNKGSATNWYWACGPEAWTKPNPDYATNKTVRPYIYSATNDPMARPLVFYSIPMIYTNSPGVWADGSVEGVYNAFDNPHNKDFYGQPGTSNPALIAPNNRYTDGRVHADASDTTGNNCSQFCVRFAWLRNQGVSSTRIDLWDDFSFGQAGDVEGYYIEWGGYPGDPTIWDIVAGETESNSLIEAFLPQDITVRYRLPTRGSNGDYELIPGIGTLYDGITNGTTGASIVFKPLPNLPTGFVFSGHVVEPVGSGGNIVVDPETLEVTVKISSVKQSITYFYYNDVYTVDFNVNAPLEDLTATVSPDSARVGYLAPYNNLPVPKRRGYDFGGWHLDPECMGSEILTTSIVSIPANHTLYAKWISKAGYFVFYDLNGADAPDAIPPLAVGWTSTHLRPSVVPERDGYVFMTWTVSQGGGRIAVTDEMAYSAIAGSASAEGITLTAQWAVNYKVFYNVNGADSPTFIEELDIFGHEGGVADERLFVPVLPADEMLRLGYVFEGWRVADNGRGVSQDPSLATKSLALTFSDLAAPDGHYIALEAVWSIDPTLYMVVYDWNYVGSANGGVFSVKENVRLLDNNLTPAPNGIPVRDGYAFMGWNTAPNGTGATVISSDRYMTFADPLAASLTLYAHWQPVKYVVHYDSNGATNVYPSVSVSLFESGLLPAPPPTPPIGFVFNRWSVSQNGVVPNVLASHTYHALALNPNAGFITLQAQWEVKLPYWVRYDMNAPNANPLVLPESPREGLSWTNTVWLPNSAAFSRPGFLFVCWNTAPNGSGRNVQSGDTYGALAIMNGQGDEPEGLTLYAQWLNTAHRLVMFDMNGATAPVVFGNQTLTTTGATVSFPLGVGGIPVKTGYAFAGWVVEEGLTGNYASAAFTNHVAMSYSDLVARLDGSPLPQPQILTVRATWVEKKFTVIYDSNNPVIGVNVSTNDTVLWSGTGLNAGAHGAWRAHIFQSWNTAPDGSGRTVLAGDRYSQLVGGNDAIGSVTLYAQWAASIYTVFYNPGYAGALPLNPASINVAPSDADLLPAPPTRYGYDFVRWDCGAVEGVTSSTTYAELAFGASYITLTACWERKTTLITLDLNYSGGGTASITATYQMLMPLNGLVPPTREGWTFSGYYDIPEDMGGTLYYTSDMTSDVLWNKAVSTATLYARWVKASDIVEEEWVLIGSIDVSPVTHDVDLTWDPKRIQVTEPFLYTVYVSDTLTVPASGWAPYSEGAGDLNIHFDRLSDDLHALTITGTPDTSRFFKLKAVHVNE